MDGGSPLGCKVIQHTPISTNWPAKGNSINVARLEHHAPWIGRVSRPAGERVC